VHPPGNGSEIFEPGSQAEERICEDNRNNGGENTEKGVGHERRRGAHRVDVRHLEARLLAENAALDGGSDGGGDDDAGEHGLVEIADDLLR